MSRLVFLLIGLAAATVGLLQPLDQSPQVQRARIHATMESHGYTASGQIDMGRAITITQFTSPECGNVRVLPVSIPFQESALLKGSESAADVRLFVYRDRIWTKPPQARAVVSHLAEQFRQMARLTPDSAIDTMLYISVPKDCRAPSIDWSRFWAAI